MKAGTQLHSWPRVPESDSDFWLLSISWMLQVLDWCVWACPFLGYWVFLLYCLIVRIFVAWHTKVLTSIILSVIGCQLTRYAVDSSLTTNGLIQVVACVMREELTDSDTSGTHIVAYSGVTTLKHMEHLFAPESWCPLAQFEEILSFFWGWNCRG